MKESEGKVKIFEEGGKNALGEELERRSGGGGERERFCWGTKASGGKEGKGSQPGKGEKILARKRKKISGGKGLRGEGGTGKGGERC